jgi:hypothetical protein
MQYMQASWLGDALLTHHPLVKPAQLDGEPLACGVVCVLSRIRAELHLWCAELLLRRPWFPGMTDIDQLGKIFQALGTPSPEQWPGLQDLPNYIEFHPTPKPPLRSLFAGVRAVGPASCILRCSDPPLPPGGPPLWGPCNMSCCVRVAACVRTVL